MFNYRKLLIFIIAIAIAMAVTYHYGWWNYFTLANLQAEQEYYQELFLSHPLITIILYFAGYVAIALLSLPVAAVYMAAGGVLFDFWLGLIIVSFASATAATVAFTVSRYLFRSHILNKYQSYMQTIDKNFQQHGLLYLFSVRLVLVIPFALVNAIMGVMPIKTLSFYVVTQLGMLAEVIVCVYTGSQLNNVENTKHLVSTGTIGIFLILACLPILLNQAVKWIYKQRKGNASKKRL